MSLICSKYWIKQVNALSNALYPKLMLMDLQYVDLSRVKFYRVMEV